MKLNQLSGNLVRTSTLLLALSPLTACESNPPQVQQVKLDAKTAILRLQILQKEYEARIRRESSFERVSKHVTASQKKEQEAIEFVASIENIDILKLIVNDNVRWPDVQYWAFIKLIDKF